MAGNLKRYNKLSHYRRRISICQSKKTSSVIAVKKEGWGGGRGWWGGGALTVSTLGAGDVDCLYESSYHTGLVCSLSLYG